MAFELLHTALRTRSNPRRYLTSFMYRLDADAPENYLSIKEMHYIRDWLMARGTYEVLADKVLFYECFRNTSLNMPRMLAHNKGKAFVVQGEERRVENTRGFAHLVKELRQSCPAGSIFAKPVDGMQGEGCRRIGEDTDLASLYARVAKARFLFQETVTQHQVLQTLHPHSINTVRVLTCFPSPGATPVVVAAILRMGVGGMDVDNASRGGLFVGVDISTGRLFPPAKQHMAFGGRVFEAHPGSGIRFDELVLPHFEPLLEASLMAARHVPHELAGWDFAIGPAGPVLIEGNPRPNLRFVEIATGGMMAKPSFPAFYEALGLGRRAGSA